MFFFTRFISRKAIITLENRVKGRTEIQSTFMDMIDESTIKKHLSRIPKMVIRFVFEYLKFL